MGIHSMGTISSDVVEKPREMAFTSLRTEGSAHEPASGRTCGVVREKRGLEELEVEREVEQI